MPIAFTPGEPSGIGPDIAIIYAQKDQKENLLVYCDPDGLIDRANKLNLPITYMPELKVIHHAHKSTSLLDKQLLFKIAKKSHKYFQSNYPL